MKAMILAAGLGTRLFPLTNNKPKALVKIAGKPLLEWTITKLISSGFTEIIINVHHFADQIIEFINSKNCFDITIEISDERDKLLNTGGGLKKAAWFFNNNEPFLLHNVDILSSINLKKFYEFHIQKKPVVTLAVSKRKTTRYLLFDENGVLCGWRNEKQNKEIITRKKYPALTKMAFSGIHIIDPSIFSLMPPDDEFSIIDFYLNISKKNLIIEFEHSAQGWIDLGKAENIEKAEKYFKKYRFF